MTPHLLLAILPSFLVLAPSPGPVDHDDGTSQDLVVAQREHGYRFHFPSESWRVLREENEDGSSTLLCQNTSTGAMWIIVVVDLPANSELEAIAEERQLGLASSFGDRDVEKDMAEISHRARDGIELEFAYGQPTAVLAEWLFIDQDRLFILQGRYTQSKEEAIDELDALRESFEWVSPEDLPEDASPTPPKKKTLLAPIPIPEPPSLDIEEGDEGTILFVRESGDFLLDARRFAQAMCLSRVRDLPACLLVEETLTGSQVDLLNRVPIANRICIGEPPESLKPFLTDQVDRVETLFEPSPRVVVASGHLGDLLEAAPLAFAEKAPLLIAGDDLEERLKALEAKTVLRVARRQDVTIPQELEVLDLSEPGRRWQHVLSTSPSPYLALANIGGDRFKTTGTPLAASLLAAAHQGMLHVIETPVHLYESHLHWSPNELLGLEGQKVAAGVFKLPHGLPISVAVPSLGPLIGISPTDKFGDPVIDLNRDGHFDLREERIAPGDVRLADDVAYSFSLRCVGAIGTSKFHDGLLANRAVALTPPAESIAESLFEDLDSQRWPDALLLAGDHREIPFDYVKDPVYAASTMHEQELATDNLYGDPNRDGYQDIAVGRFVSPSPSEATSISTRMVLYPYLSGPWRGRSTLIYPVWPDDEIRLSFPSVFASFEAFMEGVQVDLEAAGHEVLRHLRGEGDLPDVYGNLREIELLLFAHHAGPTSWMFRMEEQSAEGIRMLYAPRSKAARKLGPGCGAIPPLLSAPIVFSLGCDSCGLDYEVPVEDSIVHGFFEQGAVAYLGNMRAGFPDTEEHLFRHTLQAMLGLDPANPAPATLGEAFLRGKNYLDFLIAEMGPFTSTTPFENYGLAMRREWHSLVLYGDPAMRLNVESDDIDTPLSLKESPEDWTVEIEFDGETTATPIWIMEQVGLGPLRELTSVHAPGLSYASVPWGTFHEAVEPGKVLPGIFIERELRKEDPTPSAVEILEGPSWSLGGFRVLEDDRGRRRLQVFIVLVRYAMAKPEGAEVVERVVLRVQ